MSLTLILLASCFLHEYVQRLQINSQQLECHHRQFYRPIFQVITGTVSTLLHQPPHHGSSLLVEIRPQLCCINNYSFLFFSSSNDGTRISSLSTSAGELPRHQAGPAPSGQSNPSSGVIPSHPLGSDELSRHQGSELSRQNPPGSGVISSHPPGSDVLPRHQRSELLPIPPDIYLCIQKTTQHHGGSRRATPASASAAKPSPIFRRRHCCPVSHQRAAQALQKELRSPGRHSCAAQAAKPSPCIRRRCYCTTSAR